MSVRHALLALLREGPMYGLQLHQEFEAETAEMWPLNVGQVYTTLQRLERDGLVESDDGEARQQKSYRLTAAGHDELDEWLTSPPVTPAPPRDELVIKVLLSERLADVDVRDVIQVHRRSLVEAMQSYTALKADHAEDDIALALVVDAELFRLEAMIRWLDAADTRLARARRGKPQARREAPAPKSNRRGRPPTRRAGAR